MGNFRHMVRWVTRFVSPGAILLFVAWGVLRNEVGREALAPYTLYFGYGALAAAALAGWLYNRGRLVFTAAAFALAVWSVDGFDGLDGLVGAGDMPFHAAALLLPLNIVLFAALAEKGALSVGGALKIGLLAGQAYGITLLGEIAGGRIEAFIGWGVGSLGWTELSYPAILSFAASAGTICWLYVRSPNRVGAGMFWAVAGAFLALSRAAHPESLMVYTGMAGVVLLVAVIEHGFEVAYLDALTGMAGRRAFDEQLRRLGTRYAIAMCDVDHFKGFNDKYGHEVGDQVLRMVASKLSRIGGGSRAFRYGGEEFTVVFPNSTAKDAEPLLEAFREALADGGFKLRDKDRPKEKPEEAKGEGDEGGGAAPSKPAPPLPSSVRITISIGLAERTADFDKTERVLEAADAALYKAKEAGRNCLKTT